MLDFRPITIKDKEIVKQYASQRNFHLCEHCFVDLFMWREHYSTEICIQGDFLLVKMLSYPDKTPMYLAPIGKGDIKTVLLRLEEDAKERGIQFVMTSVAEPLKAEIETLMPNHYVFENLINGADYIYSAESMINLQGKKLQSKRNFINRFMAANSGNWQYEDITKDNIDEVYAYHLHWCKNNGCAGNGSFMGETCAIKRALNNFDELELKGGCIRLNGSIIAFTFGSRASEDMFVIQIEKAEADIPGAYPMINQQFAMRNCQAVQYINREEDLGLEGLRKAKLSYHPVMMGNKFMAMRNI